MGNEGTNPPDLFDLTGKRPRLQAVFQESNYSVLSCKKGFVGEGDEPLRPFGAPPLKRGGKATARGVAFLAPPLGELARSA